MRLALISMVFATPLYALPQGFVYLDEVAPGIQQDMRYATSNNFTGQVVPGYQRGRCILTRQAAQQLARVQQAAQKLGYSLKVYDCYRPTQAVQAFVRWSKAPDNPVAKAHFYPREDKRQLFNRGYIAEYSGHSRGSTVDLTLVRPGQSEASARPLTQCFGSTPAYLNDNSIDMGTRFDCLDRLAQGQSRAVTAVQRKNRQLLASLMRAQGFRPYPQEWWHFTLNGEPFPRQYFNFPVR